MALPVRDFLLEFVKPLVAGGDVVIGKPLSPADLARFDEELPHASDAAEEVDSARNNVLCTLVVRPPPLVIDSDELALAAALHNLLFLVHPDSDGWSVSQSMRSRVVAATRQMVARPRTENRRRVLARHALLHGLFDVQRTDVRLNWWTGSATFFGQTPPRRLQSMPGVRRVRKESKHAGFEDLFGGVEAAPIVATLLRRSPLTQLLAVGRAGPPLHWEDAVFLLRDRELARAISYSAIEGMSPGEIVAAPAQLAAAYEQLVERAPTEQDFRAVTAFLVHLNVLLALAEVDHHQRSPRSALLTDVLAPERAGQRPRGLATFFALPNALAAVDPRLAAPPGLNRDPHLRERWELHRSQVAESIGEAVITTLAGRIRRHLTPVLESADESDGPAPAHG